MHFPGLKKIKHITYRPKISIKGEPSFKLERMSHSYVCYFNEKGKLIHVINLRTDYKYTITYDSAGLLNRIIEMNKYTNQLTMENVLEHSNSKNFEENVTIYRYGSTPVIERNIHLYEENTYKAQMNVNNKGEFHTYCLISYPEENTLEEFLESKNSILYWDVKQLNTKKQEVLCYEADKNGYFDPKLGYRTTYYENGLKRTFSRYGELGIVKRHEYKYDKKGNWINQVIYSDDIPQYIYERELEYY